MSALFPVYPLYNLTPVSGKGSILTDTNGIEYLDFYGGHAVISVGHSHPHYIERINNQLSQLAFYSNSVNIPIQEELGTKLIALANYPDYRLFLANSGAEANENALKLASFHNGRSRILAIKGAFHGRTSLAVAATDNPAISANLNRIHDVTFIPFNDLDALERELSTQTYAAIIIEGIQGVAGIYYGSNEFWQLARQLCNETDTVLIADEVQSGFGRTGKFFTHQNFGIEADIISMAKGMGNGFPIGGILISPQFPGKMGQLGTTFGGNHLACAAGLAVLEIIEKENLIEKSEQIGKELKTRLENLPHVVEVRGMGLMLGLQLDQPAEPIRKKLLFEQRVFTGSSANPNTIRLLPPLTITRDEIEWAFSALQNVLTNA